MKNKLTLISSVCIGGFNDTMMYDTVIEYLGETINREYEFEVFDMNYTNKELEEEKEL